MKPKIKVKGEQTKDFIFIIYQIPFFLLIHQMRIPILIIHKWSRTDKEVGSIKECSRHVQHSCHV